MDTRDDARILMCRPDHFGVSYTINPWMDPASWASAAPALAANAKSQWRALCRKLKSLGARVELVPPVPGLPDLVFTANAAVVMDRIALLARFRHPERQGEEAHFARAFHNLDALCIIDEVRTLPEGMRLEGAGDCVWDRTRQMFWMGYGPRSDREARAVVQDCFGIETVALALADARFYHMDTALCPLSGGELLYVPQAFTAAGLAIINDRVASDCRIAIGAEDAERLAANAVCLGRDITMSRCTDTLRARLEERGYRVHEIGLGAFARSGGSAFCLTLRLDHHFGVTASRAAESVAPALVFG
ncbi:MAG TPA: arginine deiminase-related protein [Stellaceae bacterium]|nr:arginine deiminase-related protein [Stellaceae bacterium]